jgi:hypothetical protein
MPFQFHVIPDASIVFRNIYILSGSVVILSVFVILNIANPDFIIIRYHVEFTPNSYEMILHYC